MEGYNDSSDFHPELLSVREREVVDLAIEGETDERIAQAMRISTATVNSYWVRIRGKLGQVSRTEIVARMLQAGFRDTHRGLVSEVERLAGRLAASERSRERAESDLASERGGSWHLLALHFVPDALIVAAAPGHVVYANLEAERLFGVDPGYLVGREVCELTVPDGRDARRHLIREFMEAERPGRMMLGLEEPCYAQGRLDGIFRSTIAVEGFDAPEGFMGVFTVREFLGDVEVALKALRKPVRMF